MMIDLTFRAFSKARWVTVATTRGILNAQGLSNPGFEVDEIGHGTMNTKYRSGHAGIHWFDRTQKWTLFLFGVRWGYCNTIKEAVSLKHAIESYKAMSNALGGVLLR
jgi:hypothetical protein